MEGAMIGPDQDLKDFPPWIWPYIDVARLADIARVRDAGAAARAPTVAIDAHVTAIISALTMRSVAVNLSGDLKKQFEVAAGKALTVAIDDCGSTGKKPWPRPPRHIQLMEIATRLAVAAAELEGDRVLRDGLRETVGILAKQAEQTSAGG
jgi:hypothetical protein